MNLMRSNFGKAVKEIFRRLSFMPPALLCHENAAGTLLVALQP